MRIPIFLLFFMTYVQAEEMNIQRAKTNYMENCQGCHSEDGSGAGSVPNMKGNVSSFLNVSGGREFLVQVPGSAYASLNDVELAETLNWILLTFDGEKIQDDFVLYTKEEVGKLRKDPLLEVELVRAALVEKFSSNVRNKPD